MDKNSLEWNLLNYYKPCKSCGKKLQVHAFKAKAKGKPEIVYCNCRNRGCKEFGIETPPHEHRK